MRGIANGFILARYALSRSPSSFEFVWIVMAFDELIFPCLVGISDDRNDGVHNSDRDDDDDDEWMCVKWRAYVKIQNISQLMDWMNSFTWLNEQRRKKNRKGKSANTTAGKRAIASNGRILNIRIGSNMICQINVKM